MHSADLKMSAQASSALIRPATVRSAILRRWAFSFEKAFSPVDSVRSDTALVIYARRREPLAKRAP